jgi:molybdopterin converting factor small subunit
MINTVKAPETVTVEFYGVPRQRAGCAEVTVPAGPVVEVLVAVESRCPGLRGLTTPDGHLAPQYLVSLNGEQFVTDFQRLLEPGSRVLLLSADAGG